MRAYDFSDFDSIPDWSRKAVVAVAKAGLMQGYPDGSFGPARNITRAETVSVLDRLVARYSRKTAHTAMPVRPLSSMETPS